MEESLERRVALIGLSGAGKTTAAPLVAERLGWSWIDLDRAIEAKAGVTVARLFATRGEPAFRDLESDALQDALEDPRPGLVVAVGAGALERAGNRERLRARAFVVWLRVTPGAAAARLAGTGVAARPLLAGADRAPDHVEARLAEALRLRAARYGAAADASVETEGRTPRMIAEEIAERALREGLGGTAARGGRQPPRT